MSSMWITPPVIEAEMINMNHTLLQAEREAFNSTEVVCALVADKCWIGLADWRVASIPFPASGDQR